MAKGVGPVLSRTGQPREDKNAARAKSRPASASRRGADGTCLWFLLLVSFGVPGGLYGVMFARGNLHEVIPHRIYSGDQAGFAAVKPRTEEEHDDAGQQRQHGGHETHPQLGIAEQKRAQADQKGHAGRLGIVAPVQPAGPFPVVSLIAAQVEDAGGQDSQPNRCQHGQEADHGQQVLSRYRLGPGGQTPLVVLVECHETPMR